MQTVAILEIVVGGWFLFMLGGAIGWLLKQIQPRFWPLFDGRRQERLRLRLLKEMPTPRLWAEQPDQWGNRRGAATGANLPTDEEIAYGAGEGGAPPIAMGRSRGERPKKRFRQVIGPPEGYQNTSSILSSESSPVSGGGIPGHQGTVT